MLHDDQQRILENILRGSRIDRGEDHCTAIRNHLCASFGTGKTVKREFQSQQRVKEEQKSVIISYATAHRIWIEKLPTQYLTRGGESRVFLHSNSQTIIKVNDGIYYATWLEFLNSILLHNLFFSDTAYYLAGFRIEEGDLYAVLEQRYIKSDSQASMEAIRLFLEYNGFKNFKRQDYRNDEWGLLLEDMHDENVIANGGKLFFIDTVFYMVDGTE